MNVTAMPDNVTAGNTTDRPKPYDTTNAKIALSILIVEGVPIIILNIIVIVLIKRCKKRSRMYFFLLHLAIADLSVGLLDVLPNAIERSSGLAHGTITMFVLGTAACKIVKTVARTTMFSSNFILTAMSVDRAVVVTKPMISYGKGPTFQRVAIAICWGLGVLLSLPEVLLLDIYYRHNIPKCMKMLYPESWWTVYFMYDMTSLLLLPMLVIMVSYSVLLYNLNRRGLRPKSTELRPDGRPASETTHVFNRRLPRSKMKSIKLTLGIVTGYIVCWSPYFIWNALMVFKATPYHPSITIAMVLRNMNAVSNPIMFFIFHKRKVRSLPNSGLPSTEENQQTIALFLSTKRKNNIVDDKQVRPPQ